MFERISEWVDKGAEFLGVAVAVSSISLILSARGRKSWKYAAASIIAGTVVGVVVWATPAISEWAHLAAVVATITGPATLMGWEKKTITEVLDELKEANRNRDGQSSGRWGSRGGGRGVWTPPAEGDDHGGEQ